MLAARDADVAVVLRHGPTDWVRLHRWDTATDRVEDGGWLRARVPARRVDLSPDGRLLVAFVAAHGRGDDPRRDTWVAISRPPWWRALALWFEGTTWSFGGVFPDARSCAGTGPGPPDLGTVPAWFDAGAHVPHPRPGPTWTDTTVPDNRRLRDGWDDLGDGWWERTLADGAAAVVHDGPGPLPTGLATATALRVGDDLRPLPAGASLDVDRRGRALVCVGGRFEVHGGDGRVSLVADVTDQRPDPRPAPDAAGRWPGPASA